MLFSSLKRSRLSSLLIASLLLLSWFSFPSPSLLNAAPSDTIVYVNLNATGANDGSSWQNAYTDLQVALSQAKSTDSIWVAQGIYYTVPTIPSDPKNVREISFELPNGVELYGGFVGTETSLEQRDWKQNKTILSGDLERNDLNPQGFSRDRSDHKGTNTNNVIKTTKLDSSTVLDGFIITGGAASKSHYDFEEGGGGMLNLYSNPTLRNLIFSGNIVVKSLDVTGTTTNGGALYNWRSNPVMDNVGFFGNFADREGGAIFNSGSCPIITNAYFANNIADIGGALFNVGCSPKLKNAVIAGNHAYGEGSAIYNINSDLVLTNVTITGNQAAPQGGVIVNIDDSHTVIQNSIIWNNSFPIRSKSIAWYNQSLASKDTSYFTTSNSLVAGCGLRSGWNPECGIDGGNNIYTSIVPLFVHPIKYTNAPTTTGDFHLRANSPLINLGQNDFNISSIDLDGKPRIIGSNIDLGAYEFVPQLQTSVVGKGKISYSPNADWYQPNSTIVLSVYPRNRGVDKKP
jgi:hypothetical protein